MKEEDLPGYISGHDYYNKNIINNSIGISLNAQLEQGNTYKYTELKIKNHKPKHFGDPLYIDYDPNYSEYINLNESFVSQAINAIFTNDPSRIFSLKL